MNMEKLLKPKAMAIVGANEKRGSFGNYSAINALQNRESVKVYFVNAKSERVLGKQTYKSLSELPEVPDCVMLVTPKSSIPGLLREAGELGVGAAIIVAAGYSEEGTEEGRRDEREIVEIARRYDMAVMGPNCTGYVNNVDKIKMWGMGGTEFDMGSRSTGIAFFSQSGTMAIHALSCNYVDISYVFSLGNSVVLTMEDAMAYAVEDPHVYMLCLYLEGVRNGRRFMDILNRARELGKPVVIHASGMSAKGAIAAASHTGNLASSRAVYEAVCEKYGVVLVESIDEFLCAANVLGTWRNKLPAGGNVAAVNGSGGENAVCADLGEMYGVPMPDLQPETIERLKRVLPEFASPKNPLDMTAITSDTDTVCVETLTALGEDPNVDAIIFTIAQFNEPNEKDRQQAEVFGESLNERYARPCIKYEQLEGSVPVMVIPQVEDRRDYEWRMKLKAAGVPILATSLIGYKVLGKICRFLNYREEEHLRENAAPERALSGEVIRHTEAESRALLESAGVPFPRQAAAASKDGLAAAMEGLRFPLVMKISSPDIAHKTEAGGVKLNIRSAGEAEAAFDEIMESCARHLPSARLEGVLLQEMAPAGTEMIVGVTSDRQFGPMLLVGMGGVFTEVFKDTAMAACPVCREEAMHMIDSLKAARLLDGYRGSRPCDKGALAEIMVKVSRFAAGRRGTLKELDINPVIVYPQGEGAVAVDAMVVEQE